MSRYQEVHGGVVRAKESCNSKKRVVEQLLKYVNRTPRRHPGGGAAADDGVCLMRMDVLERPWIPNPTNDLRPLGGTEPMQIRIPFRSDWLTDELSDRKLASKPPSMSSGLTIPNSLIARSSIGPGRYAHCCRATDRSRGIGLSPIIICCLKRSEAACYISRKNTRNVSISHSLGRCMSEKPSRHYTLENIVITIGSVLIILALGLRIGSSVEVWSLTTLSFVCIAVIGACLIIAGILDKRQGSIEPTASGVLLDNDVVSLQMVPNASQSFSHDEHA